MFKSCALFVKEDNSHGYAVHGRLHMFHTALYRSRNFISGSFLVVTAFMVPLAAKLFNSRTGNDFNFFGPASEPPPEGLVWDGNSSEFHLASTVYPFVPDWPLLYSQVIHGHVYSKVELTHALWPTGAIWLALLFFFDAAIAGGLFGLRMYTITRPRRVSLPTLRDSSVSITDSSSALRSNSMGEADMDRPETHPALTPWEVLAPPSPPPPPPPCTLRKHSP